jgi:hypothetical protein
MRRGCGLVERRRRTIWRTREMPAIAVVEVAAVGMECSMQRFAVVEEGDVAAVMMWCFGPLPLCSILAPATLSVVV